MVVMVDFYINLGHIGKVLVLLQVKFMVINLVVNPMLFLLVIIIVLDQGMIVLVTITLLQNVKKNVLILIIKKNIWKIELSQQKHIQ